MVEKRTRPRTGTGEGTAGLQARIADLEARVARLEAARDASVTSLVATAAAVVPAAASQFPVAGPAAGPAAVHEDIGEESLAVIAAAVAAFLGERAHIRQVRLVTSEAWAQQGRVSVMASHRWAVHR
jgi:methylmalonyl-CoA carboxyltransferase 12S subunit